MVRGEGIRKRHPDLADLVDAAFGVENERRALLGLQVDRLRVEPRPERPELRSGLSVPPPRDDEGGSGSVVDVEVAQRNTREGLPAYVGRIGHGAPALGDEDRRRRHDPSILLGARGLADRLFLIERRRDCRPRRATVVGVPQRIPLKEPT